MHDARRSLATVAVTVKYCELYICKISNAGTCTPTECSPTDATITNNKFYTIDKD